MEVDTTVSIVAIKDAIEKSNNITKTDGLKAALESLVPLEKQTRLASDAIGNGKILLHMSMLCLEAGDIEELDNTLMNMSKKRGLIKQAIVDVVQKCIESIGKISEPTKRDKLIETVRKVTEGKIYLEVERARVTRILAEIYEKEGKLKEAASVMGELQVETFGSMEKRAKVDFILEQMRLSIVVGEYGKATLMSRKVTGKTFENVSFEDLKLRYLELMIALALHDERYLDCYQHYRGIFQSPSIQADEIKSAAALKMAIIFAILAPHSSEQQGILNGLHKEKKLDNLPLYKELLRTFLTRELVRWPAVKESFGDELCAFKHLFGNDAGSQKRWSHLADRVVEHNVRTIGFYYSQITLNRFASLLELDGEKAEIVFCKLIGKGMISAKFDRVSGIINFQGPSRPDALLNSWSQRVDSLLSLMVKTNYQISKEEMLYLNSN